LEAYIIATSCTKFDKKPTQSFKNLTEEVYLDLLNNAGLENGNVIGQAWFGNCGMGTFGQRNIRGQVCFTPLVNKKLFPERVGLINVEGGCATGSMAFHGAWKDIMSGTEDVALAIGVEKIYQPDRPDMIQEIYDGGIDQFDKEEWISFYKHVGKQLKKPFDHEAKQGTIFMDTYGLQALWHMNKYGTTQRQIAIAASKNHYHGSLNEKAQYQFEVSVDDVLKDRKVSYPLTRSMCAPIGDGGAAALLCSKKGLQLFPNAVQRKAIKIKSSVLTGGKYRDLNEPGLSRIAATKAYKQADLKPNDIDLLEVHDATSFCELYQLEMLGFCDEGKGGSFVEQGHASLGGNLPVNLSGGLVSKGHPVGATGLSMIHELSTQLKGEAKKRQCQNPKYAMAENGGGVIGFEEAACSVIILESQN
jgi:acetyl-CoA acetyltransferase